MSLLLLLIGMGGCATGPKVDWEGRIGAYSYDQAVIELGPPDKVADLSDGSRVAEWLTSRGGSGGGTFVMTGRFAHHYSDFPSPDYFLRLSFDPQGKLTNYRNVVK
ncbi:MAG: hypothetical protein ACO1QB_03190 [Verrucomicrobiales bacterium]